MKTALKIVLGLVAVVIVAAIALAIAVTLIFKPDDYRPLIIDAVEQNTGRSFDLQGDLGLKVLPCCSIAIGAATLGNPPGFPGGQFAKVEAAALSLKIWPLLIRQEVQIGTVTLEGLDLALFRSADGRVNWTFEDSSTPAQAPDTSATALDGLTVAGLIIRDGHLSYRDEETAAAYSITDMQLETGTIDQTLSFDLQTSMTATDEVAGISAALSMSASVSLSGDQLSARDLEATVDLPKPAPLDADVEVRARAGDIMLDLAAMSGTVTSLEIELETLGASIQLTGSGNFGAASAELRGAYEIPPASLRRLVANLSNGSFEPPDSKALTNLSGSGRWLLQAQSLRLEDINLMLDDTRLTGRAAIDDFATVASSFELQVDKLDLDRYLASSPDDNAAKQAAEPTIVPLSALRETRMTGRLRVLQLHAAQTDFADIEATLSSDGRAVAVAFKGRGLGGSFGLEGRGDVAAAKPALRGEATLADLSPRMLLAALDENPKTADPDVLTRLSGKTRWQLGPDYLALEQLALQLDQSNLSGNLRVDDFDRPATRFDLALDRLNVDAYLEPEDGAAEGPEAEIPVDLIRDLRASGKLRADELSVAKLRLLNLVASIEAANGVLRIAPLQAGVFGGEYRGTVTIDATGKTAQLSFDQQVSGIQIGDLLGTFYDTDRLAGSLSMQLTGSGAGNTETALLKAISGDISANLTDGVYRGMDLAYEVSRARSLLRKEPLPAAPATRETPIRSLSLTGRMLDGVLRSDALKAETAVLRLLGKGGVNLVEQSLDYELIAQVLGKAETATGDKFADLANLDIPLSISGAMTSPKVSVDLKRLAATTVRQTVQERARDALLDRLGGGQKDKPSAAAATTPAPAAENQSQPQPSAAPGAEQVQPVAEEPPAQEDTDAPAEQQEAPVESPKDLLKRGLRDLLKSGN